MKKLLLLLLCCSGLHAQTINIPDPAFKNRLLALGVDTNVNADIEQNEALAVTTLDLVGLGISDLTGIEAFTNLTDLNCRFNNLTSVNLSNLVNLTVLNVNTNSLTALDVSALTSLTDLDCGHNQLTSLNVLPLTQLQWLICEYNQLAALPLSGLTDITFLDCERNQITSLDLSTLDLHILDCSDNLLTAIDVSHSTSLNTFYCDKNFYASLDVSAQPALAIFYCGSPNLATLTLAGSYPALNHLIIYESILPAFTMPSTPMLTTFSMHYSPVASLDLGTCPNLFDIRLDHLPNLTYVNAKNGVNFTSVLNFYECPNLFYVCVDDTEVTAALDAFANGSNNNINGQVSNYCNFVPGGNYNTITGSVIFDGDNNGCNSADTPWQHLKVRITDNTGAIHYAFTNTAGQYTFYTQEANHTVTPQVQLPTLFSFSPTSATANFTGWGNTLTRDFCMTATAATPDIEIVITPVIGARPGFEAVYKIVYTNIGNLPTFGTVTVAYDGTRQSFVSAVPATDAQTSTLLTWNFGNLLPFESRTILFTTLINTPTANPAVNSGDILEYLATITASAGDVDPSNNAFLLNHVVVNSLDPNAKSCLEGETLSPDSIGDYLHYNIAFENIGTEVATNVVVKDVIDTTQFDIGSFQIIEASHPVVTRINANKVEFIFENINLPPSAVSSIGGHGNVLFKIKTLPALQTGDMVANTAHIYFDYNSAIDTNEARSTFSVLGNAEFVTDDSVSAYPNPVGDKVQISASGRITSVALYDVLGRVLEVSSENQKSVTLNLLARKPGVYFAKVATDKGHKAVKLVKN